MKKLVGTTLKQVGRSQRLAPGSGSGTSSSGSGSKIVPFRDPAPCDPVSAAPRRGEQEPAPKPPAKGFVPFVDDVPEVGVPSFTPFRDEVSLCY